MNKNAKFAVAIIIAIVIMIALVAVMRARKESFTAEEAGTTGVIALPYNPLARFEFFPNKDSASFADIALAGPLSSSLSERHRFLAQRCDETPGCVAFTSTGYLKSGVLHPSARQNADYSSGNPVCLPANCGLFVRKNAVAEPLFVELFVDINYGATSVTKRVLVPPGRYSDFDLIGTASGVIGGKMPRGELSSIKIPIGLKVTLYNAVNFGGKSLDLRHGDYPDLRQFKTGNILYPTWNDEAESIIVEYDPTV